MDESLQTRESVTTRGEESTKYGKVGRSDGPRQTHRR
jgi:hypothetical protein